MTGVTLAESEKQDKVKAHRAYRRRLKQMVSPDLETPLPLEKELKDVWEMAKEGKSYDATVDPKRMRK